MLRGQQHSSPRYHWKQCVIPPELLSLLPEGGVKSKHLSESPVSVFVMKSSLGQYC